MKRIRLHPQEHRALTANSTVKGEGNDDTDKRIVSMTILNKQLGILHIRFILV